MAYTAEEFEQILRAWTFEPTGVYEDEVIVAALRIASAVMRPGFMERIEDELSEHGKVGYTVAPAIRAALTDVKP